ncbi:hypothetical protein [Pedobacter alluvionis]|uniref:Secreted protein n=1 Tax=Pedobacter alluvionis TaxID=475253 RepID=A0A497YB58_9SPHI|nr:hypothetical protein [Pedobacter alluvionis]RLJ79928.1 hypothetical protein BCL90_0651 [Pedobacter alluvionis]TFB31234.1 hypothetical protein E3V97_11545 [Pedobacter alluvionis]
MRGLFKALIPNSLFGFFFFDPFILGNEWFGFSWRFPAPIAVNIPMKDRNVHCNRVYLLRIVAQSAPPKPDRSGMPIFSIGRSGGGTELN